MYQVRHGEPNRIYALKVLSPALAEDDQFRDRFKREMRLAASLHHQAGLDTNIMLSVRDGEEHAYLTDFGLAKKFDTASSLTLRGALVGTVEYMTPEQITGAHTDARTDIYALGCVLFEMLTGNVPYERENLLAVSFAHVQEPPPPLERGLGTGYPAFHPVLAKAMAKEPADRYVPPATSPRAAAAAAAVWRPPHRRQSSRPVRRRRSPHWSRPSHRRRTAS
ncbi:MAG: serine/threonine protein kinase [Solirubrobacterales bacterium]|nr:serine/threonine protein kinase [Solirubrobacterales bacterium]MBV9714339.1 serine/threonine protein kinase [Solirubrobacterales bacterium]